MPRFFGSAGDLAGLTYNGGRSHMRRLVEELGPGRNVVTVLPDTGERYFSLSGRLQDPA